MDRIECLNLLISYPFVLVNISNSDFINCVINAIRAIIDNDSEKLENIHNYTHNFLISNDKYHRKTSTEQQLVLKKNADPWLLNNCIHTRYNVIA